MRTIAFLNYIRMGPFNSDYMENKKEIKGWEIGKSISIHSHLTDPESWFVTIRPLNIYGESLCKKTCSQEEVFRYVNVVLHKKLSKFQEIMNDLIRVL